MRRWFHCFKIQDFLDHHDLQRHRGGELVCICSQLSSAGGKLEAHRPTVQLTVVVLRAPSVVVRNMAKALVNGDKIDATDTDWLFDFLLSVFKSPAWDLAVSEQSMGRSERKG